MAQFSVTDAAFTGFQFIKARPKVFGIWVVAQIVISLAFGLLAMTVGGPALIQIQNLNSAGRTDPREVLAAFSHLLPFYGLMIVFALAIWPVIFGAMNRAILRPQEDRLAYLRFGPDELRQLGLIFLSAAVGIGAYIAVVVIAVICVVVGAMALKAAAALASLLGALIILAILCGFVFVAVRLSLASALTFTTGRINLFGSWSLTKGQFWPIFGTMLLVSLISLILELSIFVLVGILIVLPGSGLSWTDLMRPDMSSVGAFFTPGRLIVQVAGSVLSAIMLPLALMPYPAIYQSLTTSTPPSA